jgi:hypothetical protein
MAVQTDQIWDREIVYTVGSTPTTGPFDIPFLFQDNDEIKVLVGGEEETALVEGNYVELDVAVSNTTVTILSSTGETRNTAETFVQAELSKELDRVFALFQELAQKFKRTVRLGYGEEAEVYTPSDGAVPVWNETAKSFENGTTIGQIDDAAGHAAAAAASETAAAASASAASTSETNASAFESKAEDWATEAEDVEVEPGLYSAFHWAKKAEGFAPPGFLKASNNLSDVDSQSTSRLNLGLGTAATQDANTFLQVSNNLSDVNDAAASRENLGLGTTTARNAIINGNFDHWQRGTSFTGFEYGADRWYNVISGSSATQSRQAFALGQTDVPNEPEYFCRTAVTSSAGAGNYAILQQRIEDVRTFAGQTVALSFWAKADAARNIAVEFAQTFGSGGSPSSQVDAIGVTTASLTTVWQKFTVTAEIPSIAGKTLGTNGNDHLGLFFWFDAGSDFNARTNSLGQQSGTFDIAQVQLEAGTVATPFERRPVGTELALCQRYFEKGFLDFGGYVQTGIGPLERIIFANSKRIVPSVSLSNLVASGNVSTSNFDTSATTDGLTFAAGSGTGSGGFIASANFAADAEL